MSATVYRSDGKHISVINYSDVINSVFQKKPHLDHNILYIFQNDYVFDLSDIKIYLMPQLLCTHKYINTFHLSHK